MLQPPCTVQLAPACKITGKVQKLDCKDFQTRAYCLLKYKNYDGKCSKYVPVLYGKTNPPHRTQYLIYVFGRSLTLSHLGGGGGFNPWETFFNNSKTAQDIKMKFVKFNLTLMGVILHKMTILINLRCCHGNFLLWMCRGREKWRNLHICQDIGLILLKFGVEGYFWILNPKSTKVYIRRHSDVKMTWRQNTHTSLAENFIWRHYDVTFCSIFLKTSIFLLLIREYQHSKFGLIWVKESKVTERGGIRPSPRLRMY